MSARAERIRDALGRQWRLIAQAAPSRDLDIESRVPGWRNREVLAHLGMQPPLLVRFLATAGHDAPELDAARNLSGTRQFAELVDAATREAAAAGPVDFSARVEDALARLAVADLAATVTTLQGPILLVDYVVTRCVEAVVHGGDLVPPVDPDAETAAIVADALTALLAAHAPGAVPTAEALPPLEWIAVATGRKPPPRPLAGVVPLMA